MYNFRINHIKTKSHQEIKPCNVNIIIGPNNSGKSQFLKDIKNILQRNNGQNPPSILVDEMEYELPSNAEQFIDRYSINEKVFRTKDSQYYIKNFSGINNYMFETQYSFDNYLDSGNINISQNWEKELEEMIFNFQDSVVLDEKIKKDFNLPENAVIHEKRYAEYVENKMYPINWTDF